MSKTLYEILLGRSQGRFNAEDRREYISRVDSTVVEVYCRRYRLSRDEVKYYLNKGQGNAEKDFAGGALRVDPLEFRNRAWELMEDERLWLRALDGTPAHVDAALVRYIRKSFENHLQEMIDNLAPGTKTRKLQINRLLKEICVVNTFADKEYWVLKDLQKSNLQPADLDALKRLCGRYKPPEARYPKRRDHKYEFSIPDGEMKTYLTLLIETVGGAVFESDLLDFVKERYGIAPVARHNLPDATSDSPAENEDHALSALSHKRRNEECAEQDLFQSAAELFKKMSARQREFYYLIHIQDEDYTAIRKKMRCALGTVAKQARDIEKLFKDYYYDRSTRRAAVSENEFLAVKSLLKLMVLRHRQVR